MSKDPMSKNPSWDQVIASAQEEHPPVTSIRLEIPHPIVDNDSVRYWNLHNISNLSKEERVKAAELLNWWVGKAIDDFQATVPKMLEYGGPSAGSADLRIMGDALAELVGIEDREVAMELGAWFYALGKVARLVSDYKQGRRGKSDTWFDLGVYAMMARRIQETGQWP